MQVITSIVNGYMKAKVILQKRDSDGNQISARKKTHFIDSRVYNIELDDGTLRDYAENLITENM